MRITFHVSHMPNVICETNMKRESKFSKNVPPAAAVGTEERERRHESFRAAIKLITDFVGLERTTFIFQPTFRGGISCASRARNGDHWQNVDWWLHAVTKHISLESINF